MRKWEAGDVFLHNNILGVFGIASSGPRARQLRIMWLTNHIVWDDVSIAEAIMKDKATQFLFNMQDVVPKGGRVQWE